MNILRCKKCILPFNFPGIKINHEGICQYCLNDQDNIDLSAVQKTIEINVLSVLGKAPSYDIVLAYSGGKDSTYTLLYLKEVFPKARIVAITVDNDFLSERARKNCQMVSTALGIDHIMFRPNPKALQEIYRISIKDDVYGIASLKRASAICNSCIQVINTQILTFASNYDIPFVVGGYIGGQVPSHTGIMEQSLSVTAKIREGFLEQLAVYLGEEAVRLFVQPIWARGTLTIVNPMIYLNPSEDEIFGKLSSIGWEKPEDTGNSSTNCLLNDFAIYEHLKRCCFHPYIFEIATMVRKGLISREEALKKIDVKFNDEEFVWVRKKLGMKN